MVKAMRNYSTIFPNKNAWQLMDNKENESMESYDPCILKEHGIKKRLVWQTTKIRIPVWINFLFEKPNLKNIQIL